jgi:hypothetical protein
MAVVFGSTGRPEQACYVFETVLTNATHLGLYSEEEFSLSP